MPKVALVFRTEVVPGADDEFNRWSNEHHIPDFSAKLPGVTSIRRFSSKESKRPYITVYEFSSLQDLGKCLNSKEYEKGNQDAATQLGKTVKRFSSDVYEEIFSYTPRTDSSRSSPRPSSPERFKASPRHRRR